MRKIFAVVLTVAVAVVAIPSTALAAVRAGSRPDTGSMSGVAQDANKNPLANYTVRVRNATTGKEVASTTSGGAGDFSFSTLDPANYIVEVVDATGKVVAATASVPVAAGATVSLTVTSSLAGAIASAAGGGLSLFGLGTLATVAVIGAVGATTVALVATKDNASPAK